MPSSNKIEKEWRELAALTLPPDASIIQRMEMRKAFFAGAISMFSMIFSGLDPSSPDMTSADESLLDDLSSEMEEYINQMKSQAEGLKHWTNILRQGRPGT
jgi:hypothetical protein